MNTKVLVTYASMSGSTAEVAQAVADQLNRDGVIAELKPIAQVTDISSYDAVVLGAPMILEWYHDMVNFIVKNQEALKSLPTAYFLTQLHLTRLPETEVGGVPVYLDLKLAQAPVHSEKLSTSEKLGSPASCVGSTLKKAPMVKPLSIGFFGGELDYGKLKFFPWLFVKLIIRGKEGDYRNWDAIREWTEIIRPQLEKARGLN